MGPVNKVMDCTQIKQMIEAGIDNCDVSVTGDDGVHFEAIVVSEDFEGIRTLQRHRMVYATLGDQMGGDIHALALTTRTPAEQQELTERG